MDLIVFDGFCVLCSRSMRFIAGRDRAGRFGFVPLQSPFGLELAGRYGISVDNPETFVAIIDGNASYRSDAAIGVLSRLPGFAWTKVLRWVPRPVRDAAYNLVARNRYRWFGRYDRCQLAPPGLAGRILEEAPGVCSTSDRSESAGSPLSRG